MSELKEPKWVLIDLDTFKAKFVAKDKSVIEVVSPAPYDWNKLRQRASELETKAREQNSKAKQMEMKFDN